MILTNIANSTHCTIEFDNVSLGYLVRGDMDDGILEAIEKLKVVNAAAQVSRSYSCIPLRSDVVGRYDASDL